MAELGLAASIVAVIQISGKVVSLTNSFLNSVQDAPRDLQAICIETSAIKNLFESLNSTNDSTMLPPDVQKLGGQNGPIEGCRRCVSELEKLVNVGSQATTGGKR